MFFKSDQKFVIYQKSEKVTASVFIKTASCDICGFLIA